MQDNSSKQKVGLEELRRKLDERGGHMTRQREAVYEYLSSVAHHPTAEEVFLNLQRSAEVLMRRLAEVLKPSELTATQYNVLRILRGAEPVGFAMVARGSAGPGRAACDYRMAEFFVARTFRRRGVGRLAVELILNRFAGRWEITEYLRNPVAVAFWRRVVANYTQGRFQERVLNGEVRQVFESGSSRAQKPA